MPSLSMDPPLGERLLRFVGDRVRFTLRSPADLPPATFRAFLRTDLGRADAQRRAILSLDQQALGHRHPWRDIPMQPSEAGWSVDIVLTELGYFQAKAFLRDERDWQHWPDGDNLGISVHANSLRTRNTLYCAFPRLFGATRTLPETSDPELVAQLAPLDRAGFTVIPPSGKLRDLKAHLPHIASDLGCRILHLLPVNPTPTTYARLGRFGSPYAAQDLTAVDPALVDFDKRTTGIDQFMELTRAAHELDMRVLIDIVTNHTGWGSDWQEDHPQYFLRNQDGTFASPGAWGTTWEDLVELDHRRVELRHALAEVFLTWCRRGVDGFRCDAGYKVPLEVWRHIVARVRAEFPETLFFLEGLGGGWHATEALLTEGGMQWAYSELFQEYTGQQTRGYLQHALKQSKRIGTLVHYSETHDNLRLAARGRTWSLLRNRLCALTSVSGAFGFTCGVEWLAAERIAVHECRGLRWGHPDNIIPQLRHLTQLLADHPCFFDGVTLTPAIGLDSEAYGLWRESADGLDHCLVLANTDPDHPVEWTFAPQPPSAPITPLTAWINLLDEPVPPTEITVDGQIQVRLDPGQICCLTPTLTPIGLTGPTYRHLRALAAFALQALQNRFEPEEIGPFDWPQLARQIEADPLAFLGSIHALDARETALDLNQAIRAAQARETYPGAILWEPGHERRITPVPPNHWILLRAPAPFRAHTHPQASDSDPTLLLRLQSIAAGPHHIAAIPPARQPGDDHLEVDLLAEAHTPFRAVLRHLAPQPTPIPESIQPQPSDLVLLTNARGGMARLRVDLGSIQSKYDCLLAANLHPSVPVDRHVFAKRLRLWANIDGFLAPLDGAQLTSLEPGAPVTWTFAAQCGDDAVLPIRLQAWMPPGTNAVVLRLSLPSKPPAHKPVRVSARVDIEDRSFHWETKRNPDADRHFQSNSHPLHDRAGFRFEPAPDRRLTVHCDRGQYHPSPEWSEHLPHPIEASRGQEASGDAFSPGWFEIPLDYPDAATLIVSADPDPAPTPLSFPADHNAASTRRPPPDDPFARQLEQAIRAFVVQRGAGRTVIAGYPWFLDWGRDTLICARGLIAAGLHDDVRQILATFGRFEQNGTLPNSIHGEDASNRDTSDAPLWFGVVCDELAEALGPSLYQTAVAPNGPTLADVLRSIAAGCLRGTPNGIRTDPLSGLLWSPSHFTWMDTNYPAGTPRQGYPVEIQALWIRLLRQLHVLDAPHAGEPWAELAERAALSLENFFWLEHRGWIADVLLASPGVSAVHAVRDSALRSNSLLAIALGLFNGPRAQQTVRAAIDHLVVPGALRSLAPLPVHPPLPIQAPDGRPLNDPNNPYWGRYEGDEDTRRKPAYHNGTAWTWTFPSFCEALAQAWNYSPEATHAARAWLGSTDQLLRQGCIGHLPEIVDGDAPHTQRGCDAQAWSVTETLRVWRKLAPR